jgi:ABC-2 type transport system ATP-binding protein
MRDDIAIKVDGVSKTFRLPHEKNNSIKSAAINFYRHKRTYEKLEALKDISFEVKKGEFFGIVGRNGSGKSTMLKLLAGIYSPSAGNIAVNGKLTPFIELGVGFNPELTGRENVFLNGALLGFGRKDMATMYDDIVTFAELERFMDQKLKNYSSGMQVRLAFSIAIRVQSDILVLDEVLAVGDEAFQQKCIDIFEKYQAQKQTIVLVTHDMEIVRRFCSRAMLIHDGEMVSIGEPREVAQKYSKFNKDKIEQELGKENVQSKKSNINLKILNKEEQKVSFDTDQTLKVGVSWPKDLPKVKNVGIAIMKQSGEFIFGANTFGGKLDLKGICKIDYEVKLSLGPGKYSLVAGLFGDKESEVVDYLGEGPKFIVRSKSGDTSQGLAHLKHDWSL